MKELKKRILNHDKEITFESLREFIATIELDKLEYESYIEAPETEGDYGRNIITTEPFECVVIHWPTETESAIHLHEGLFGYVWVLEGELDNHLYERVGDKLVEKSIDRFAKNGLIPEPDGVIHKLRNNSKVHRAISIHFYYPAIESFAGMRLYNLDNGDVGVLSDEALTASWNETRGHFERIERNVFEFVSYEEFNKRKSHFISNIIPKPDKDRINKMNRAYFNEQAEQYDFSDFNQPKRKRYTNKIDELIAEDLKADQTTKKHLDIATGTGRRALHIQNLSGLNYEIVGVDISKKMCEIAATRGIRTYHQDWANDDIHIGEYFDSASFLYAFGHLADHEARVKTIRKIHDYLNPNGTFYVDLFNIDNENEWGPLAMQDYKRRSLGDHDYDIGDVFYRKRGCNEVAFLHYFSREEAVRLLEDNGFQVEWIKMVGYAKNPGEIVTSEKEGNFFIKARKK